MDAESPSDQYLLRGRSYPCFIDLMKNDNQTFLSASRTLLRFANNILKSPDNLRYRSIRLGNEVFMLKLLPVDGAVDCLFSMGFKEIDDHLYLDPSTSLDDLRAIRAALLDENAIRVASESKGPEPTPESIETDTSLTCLSDSLMSSYKATFPIIVAGKRWIYAPPLRNPEENIFYKKIRSQMNVVLMYEDPRLQELARRCIPIKRLQEQAKKGFESASITDSPPAQSEKDHLLLQLLAWFKKDFFSWTNAPKCNLCGAGTKHHSGDTPNTEERKWDCSRVECYQCAKCDLLVRFPRYNHPQKLLETRTGRCGEWANCFTLCCRAVGFEARFVVDWTDHVWTEVYSEHQRRYLHCDSCENTCDKPHLYEKGWGKKLSYVVGLSKDDVVDVTWRYTMRDKDLLYTSLRKEVLARRNLVSESWLVDFCVKSTSELQRDVADDRKSELSTRRCWEIVESLSPRGISKTEEQGRVSGSAEWRKARGEYGNKKSSFSFFPLEENIRSKKMRIRYYPVSDSYLTSIDDIPSDAVNKIMGWENGVELCENVFRKVEHDWNMVYLARSEASDAGTIRWCLDAGDSGLIVSLVDIKVHTALYENGRVELSVYSEDKRVELVHNGYAVDIPADSFAGSKTLRVSVCLKGGVGDVAWQHAQLFRSAQSQNDFVGLEINVSFQ